MVIQVASVTLIPVNEKRLVFSAPSNAGPQPFFPLSSILFVFNPRKIAVFVQRD